MEQNTEQEVFLAEMPISRYGYKAEGLPFEKVDPACTEPKDVNQLVKTVWEDLLELDSHAIAANRFADNYRIVSRGLEGLVRRMGSLLLTQAVFEQQGYYTETPDDLSVCSLSAVVNYHFNKAHAAAAGTKMLNPKFYIAMLIQEARWAGLQERLGATGEKIRQIREGKLVIRKAEKNAPKGAEKSASESSDVSVRASGPAALPVIHDLLPDPAGETRASDPSDAAAGEIPEQAVPENAAAAAVPGSETPEASETEAAGADPDEQMMRELLSGAAITLGDRSFYERIQAAGSAELRSAWELFIAQEERYGYPVLREMGVAGGGPPEVMSPEVIPEAEYV